MRLENVRQSPAASRIMLKALRYIKVEALPITLISKLMMHSGRLGGIVAGWNEDWRSKYS